LQSITAPAEPAKISAPRTTTSQAFDLEVSPDETRVAYRRRNFSQYADIYGRDIAATEPEISRPRTVRITARLYCRSHCECPFPTDWSLPYGRTVETPNGLIDAKL
jgi:hypothetical protein